MEYLGNLPRFIPGANTASRSPEHDIIYGYAPFPRLKLILWDHGALLYLLLLVGILAGCWISLLNTPKNGDQSQKRWVAYFSTLLDSVYHLRPVTSRLCHLYTQKVTARGASETRLGFQCRPSQTRRHSVWPLSGRRVAAWLRTHMHSFFCTTGIVDVGMRMSVEWGRLANTTSD